jgi:hypothetical protein
LPWLHPDLSHPASCLPSLGTVLLPVPPAALKSNGLGIMKALTPAALTRGDRSLRLPRLAFPAFRPQPRDPSDSRFQKSPQRHRLLPGFATNEQARHGVTPKQVRHPTDCRFTSGCSPPRFAATQLPSIMGLRPTPGRTYTVPTKRPHGRTHPARFARGAGPANSIATRVILAACRTEVLKFRGGAGFSASRGRLTSYRG